MSDLAWSTSFDRTFTTGEFVYTTFRYSRGKITFEAQHFERLQSSVRMLWGEDALNPLRESWKSLQSQCRQYLRLEEKGVKFLFKIQPLQHRNGGQNTQDFLPSIEVFDLGPWKGESYLECFTVNDVNFRESWRQTVKTMDLDRWLRWRSDHHYQNPSCLPQGVLWVEAEMQKVHEFMWGNLLAGTNEGWVSPPPSSFVFQGIGVATWAARCREQKEDLQRREIRLEELDTVKSLYMVNSVRGLVPVTKLNEKSYNHHQLDDNKKLNQEFWVRAYDEVSPV
jgi:branched-subunit amino acid aminotransferase/4-amino-4-deoxychorismate lyase